MLLLSYCVNIMRNVDMRKIDRWQSENHSMYTCLVVLFFNIRFSFAFHQLYNSYFFLIKTSIFTSLLLSFYLLPLPLIYPLQSFLMHRLAGFPIFTAYRSRCFRKPYHGLHNIMTF